MVRDPLRVTDGFASLEMGVDSGRNPSLLPRTQASWAENLTFRGGFMQPRPGYKRIPLLESDAATAAVVGKFQGADVYQDVVSGNSYLILHAGGALYRFVLGQSGATVTDISVSGDPNSAVVHQAWMCQAENYLIVQDGQSKAIIFDGTTSRRALDDEVPVGSGPMAYGQLRLWVAIGNTYVAGDVAGGPTGVLKFTENDYIAEGGAFSLPMSAGNITAMRFVATPNTGLGQGELLIFTPTAVFSNTAPPDRDAWKILTQPIQTITLINNGGMSQDSTVLVNSDVFMRSLDGMRSVIQAVRYYNEWGNTPMSNEVKRVIDKDSQLLLNYASAVEFDNRLLMTCQPVPITNGAYHTGLIALDFDLVTSMREKLPPAFDGLWTGINIYKIIKGRFGGVERCFAFARSSTDGFVDAVYMTAAGTGYTSVPTVGFTGGGGSGATATATLKAVSLAITAGGTGYTAGDILLVTGGTSTIPVRIVVNTVAAGVITDADVLIAGSYSALPANPVAVTGGTGANDATFTLTWGVNAVTVTASGTGYTSNPTVTFTGGAGSGAAAVADIEYRMELWEITKDSKFDYDLDSEGAPVENRIEWFVETRSCAFNSDTSSPANMKRLETGDLWIDRVTGTVDFELHYRPDQYPCWNPWYAWQVCQTKCLQIDATGCTFTAPAEQYRPRQNMPQPPALDNESVGLTMKHGYEFMARLSGTGFVRVKLFRMHAKEVVERVAYPVVPTTETCSVLACDCE